MQKHFIPIGVRWTPLFARMVHVIKTVLLEIPRDFWMSEDFRSLLATKTSPVMPIECVEGCAYAQAITEADIACEDRLKKAVIMAQLRETVELQAKG